MADHCLLRTAAGRVVCLLSLIDLMAGRPAGAATTRAVIMVRRTIAPFPPAPALAHALPNLHRPRQGCTHGARLAAACLPRRWSRAGSLPKMPSLRCQRRVLSIGNSTLTYFAADLPPRLPTGIAPVGGACRDGTATITLRVSGRAAEPVLTGDGTVLNVTLGTGADSLGLATCTLPPMGGTGRLSLVLSGDGGAQWSDPADAPTVDVYNSSRPPSLVDVWPRSLRLPRAGVAAEATSELVLRGGNFGAAGSYCVLGGKAFGATLITAPFCNASDCAPHHSVLRCDVAMPQMLGSVLLDHEVYRDLCCDSGTWVSTCEVRMSSEKCV